MVVIRSLLPIVAQQLLRSRDFISILYAHTTIGQLVPHHQQIFYKFREIDQ